jgi:transposase-like protein
MDFSLNKYIKKYKYMQELGLVPGAPNEDRTCEKCNSKLKLLMRKSNKTPHLNYRCSNSKCQSYVSCFRGTFFSLFTTPFVIILIIIQHWAAQLTIAKSVDLCTISGINCGLRVTRVTFQRLRNICSYMVRPELGGRVKKLGGPGKIVEIDESLVAKIKYHRGSGLGRKQIWLFGLVERGDGGRCYLTMVPNRKAETLLQVIYDHVEPGTVIVSDSWSSYRKLNNLNFGHATVNHSVNFLDPETGAHTNKIEGLWAQAKRKFKEMNGCSRVHLQSYILRCDLASDC